MSSDERFRLEALEQYRIQQRALRLVAEAQYEARCQQEKRERRAAMIWLFPTLGLIAFAGWLCVEIFKWAAR